MKTRSFLVGLAVMALACAAGAAYANTHPDVFVAALNCITAHPDLGVLSLAWGPVVRKLQTDQATNVKSMSDMIAKAEGENRDFNDEEKIRFDALKAENASYKARIERAQEAELAEAGVAQPVAAAAASRMAEHNDGRSVTVPAGALIQVEHNADADPLRGFTHFGDFASAIVGASLAQRNGRAMDQRLLPLAAAPSTYANEASGADGGILVPPGFGTDIFRLSLGEDALLPMTDSLPIEGNSMMIPKDETTPWGTNGIRAYWQAEGAAGTPTKPVLTGLELKLKKLLSLVPVSNELLADATALNAYLPSKVGDSIRWKANEAVLFGSGVGVPLGALAGASLITVVKDSGQATNTLSATNLANMIARLPPGSYPRAVWMINNDVLPALFTLTLGNYPIYLPGGTTVGGIQTNPYGMLLGRPIMVTQHAKSFSSQGDILLVDLSYYQTIVSTAGVQTATSMHLYFDADAMAFRTTFRMDGQPKLAAPITPANGSNTLSPFVQLGAR